MKFGEWFKGFFHETDDDKRPSSFRAIFWIWMLILCFNITYINVKGGNLTDIPSAYTYITAIVFAGKIGQRWLENKIEPPNIIK